jgi:hypothetical protein
VLSGSVVLLCQWTHQTTDRYKQCETWGYIGGGYSPQKLLMPGALSRSRIFALRDLHASVLDTPVSFTISLFSVSGGGKD